MNDTARSSEPPDEPYLKSQPTLLSPASPKPLQFPQPTNIPVLENMMDVGFNQTELHMNDQSARNTELRPDAWRDPGEQPALSNANDDQVVPDSGSIDTDNAIKQEEPVMSEPAVAAPPTSGDSLQPNGNDAQSASHANGVSHDANSQLPDSHVQEGVTDAQVSDNISSVPTAESEPVPSTTETVQPQFSEFAIPQAQSTPAQEPVDVQALLDTLQTSIAPTTELTHAPGSGEPQSATVLSPSQSQKQPPIPGAEALSSLSASGLGAPPSGLPPRPPPQDQPLINSNYVHSQHISDYHPHAAAATTDQSNNNLAQSPTQAQNGFQNAQAAVPAGTAPGYAQQLSHFSASTTPIESRREFKLAAGETPTLDDQPWTQDIQRKYDHFMEEERRYVNEARWDQFPQGSRLFVGNLSSEKVTKRDIFHVFHSYGDLAQISIKQAYGFVQFLRTEDCQRALSAEQGRQVRDKRIHLEISKPQKSSKKQEQSRRSRSPDNRGRRGGNNVDRYVGGGRNGDNRGRDGRDNYRGGYRSPSPRDYRDRYGDRYRERSRSPGYGRGYRGASPRRDAEDDLPLPRRQPRDVPDVQLIALDQLDRDFLSWVEKAFASRGVRVDVLILSPRLSEEAVVRRQIVEGVLAVSKLRRANQDASKIGLTIFKRNQSTRDVNFEEYDNLDPSICVELVLREKQAQGTAYGNYQYAPQQPPQPPQHQYGMPPQQAASYGAPAGYPPGYGQPPAPYGAAQQRGPPGPGQQPMNMDPNNLQNLLSTLNQQKASQTPQSAGPYGAPSGYPPQAYPPQQDPYAAYRNNPAYAGMLPGQQGNAPQQHTQQPPAAPPQNQSQPNMQDILARLGTYRQ